MSQKQQTMKTIIAEKPSVAKEIAHIVGADKREEGYMQGNGYYVTWAFGHLVQPAMPETYGMKGFHAENLPVIPDPFVLVPRQVKTENGYKPDAGVLAQIKIIGKLFDSSERIIVATDAGREGELIFRYLYAYLGCRKPFDRLWISSLTDTAIREGLLNLRDGKEYDNLYHAAKARSEADWLVGINGTQALTIAAGRGTYSVGRVQTPTLGMVCERYWEHKRFESKPFWQVHFGVVDADSGNILKFTSANRWTDKATATDIYNKVVTADKIIDRNGAPIADGEQGGTKAGFLCNSASMKEGKLALYVCNVEGETKYVIPVYGMGLWGGINGYIALNADKQTVYGAYFNHEGETAGLGAEIKDSRAWQDQFKGKHVFAEGKDGVALSVVKKNEVTDPSTQCDAVTGATLTCNGVSDMLKNCLGEYTKFLTSK